MAITNLVPNYFLGTSLPNPKVLGSKVQEIITALNDITDGVYSFTTLTATTANITTANITTLAAGTSTLKKTVLIESGTPATITAAQSGTVFIGTKGSATQTYTLPTTPTAGTFYTFTCGHASGEVLINPATGEKIVGTVLAAVGADADTAVISNTTTGIKNTAATNAISDNITLMFDGVDTWFIQGLGGGIWASQ